MHRLFSSSRAQSLFVWGCLALVPILNWPATALPFDRDEGEFLWAATIAARGGVPYRDVFLVRPPGIILAARAFLATTDGSARAVHIGLLIVYIFIAIGIGAIAWKVSGRAVVAALAITFYALSLSTPLYQASAITSEAFMGGAIVAGVYALLRARESHRVIWVIVLGFALGLAGMMKQTAAPHVAWILPTIAFAAPTPRDRWRWPIVVCLAAAFAVAAVCLPYFFFGAGRELLDGVIWHTLEYGHAIERGSKSRHDISSFHIALWLVALYGIVVLIRKRQWWSVIVLGGWVATAWIGVSAGSFYRGHYFLQLLPPIAILAAIALAEAPRRIRIAAIPLSVLYWLLSNGLQWTSNEAALAEQRYHTLFFENAVLVGRWLRQQPDRSLYALASEPEIYYYADATPVSRYVVHNSMFNGFASSRARQREVWDSLQRQRPRWIITVAPRQAIPFFSGADPWLINQVERLLAAEYRPRMAALGAKPALTTIGGVAPSERQMTIWEKLTPAAP
jgi:hypothetical protein